MDTTTSPRPGAGRAIPRPPAAVTFDCWSTLLRDLDSDGAQRRRGALLAALATRLGRETSPEEGSALIGGAWNYHVAEWRSGRLVGPEGAAAWCFERLGLPGEPDSLEELAHAIATGTLATGTAAVEGAAEALASVQARGIPTALICDTGFTPSWCVREALEKHGIALDHYYFSDEVGVPKPHPEIFRAALEAAGARAAGSVHIGDLRRTDIAGARAAGMASIRFAGVHDDGWLAEDCRPDVEADAVLYRWSDLAALLGL